MLNTRVWLAIVLVLLVGNSTWQVQRALNTNREVLENNEQLLKANSRLLETNVELIEANGQLNETNAELNQNLRRMLGLPPLPPVVVPNGSVG